MRLLLILICILNSLTHSRWAYDENLNISFASIKIAALIAFVLDVQGVLNFECCQRFIHEIFLNPRELFIK